LKNCCGIGGSIGSGLQVGGKGRRRKGQAQGHCQDKLKCAKSRCGRQETSLSSLAQGL